MRWDDDETPQPQVSHPAAGANPAQRLTVQYLLVWMTGTSILLGLYMAGPGRPHQDHMPILIGLGIVRFVASILYGAALASWWLVATGWYRGEIRYPLWAGHWLCLIISLKELLLLATTVLVFAILSSVVSPTADDDVKHRATQVTFTFVPAVASIVAIGGWATFLIWPTQPIRWKIYAGIRIAAEACSVAGALLLTLLVANSVKEFNSLMILYPLLAMTGLTCGLAAFIAAFVVLIIDVAYGEKRDWLHWLGVTTALASPPLGMLLWYGAVMGETMKAMKAMERL